MELHPLLARRAAVVGPHLIFHPAGCFAKPFRNVIDRQVSHGGTSVLLRISCNSLSRNGQHLERPVAPPCEFQCAEPVHVDDGAAGGFVLADDAVLNERAGGVS